MHIFHQTTSPKEYFSGVALSAATAVAVAAANSYLHPNANEEKEPRSMTDDGIGF